MSVKAEQQKGKFLNQIPTEMNPEGSSMWKALGQMIRGVPNRRPTDIIETAVIENPGIETESEQGGMAEDTENWFRWLGHSTVFLSLSGVRILVDPVFSNTASPFPIVGPKAFPYTHPYQVEQFLPLDIVLISHDHYDHLDKKAIQQLSRSVKQFIVPLGVSKILIKWGLAASKIKEMAWGDQFKFDEFLTIRAQTARHFSGRALSNRDSTLWCSYVIQSPGVSVYFSGDSGYGPHFAEIGRDFGPFDLAFVECGQYNTNWPLIHMMPEQTVQAAIDLHASTVLPIHWGTFSLSLHAWDEPPKRAQTEAERLKQNILIPKIGEKNIIPSADSKLA